MAALDPPVATGPASGAGEPAPHATTPAAPPAATGGGIGWDAIVPVLGTIVTGAGLLGFVALFGGAILFTRADEAGLPASQTVALLPKSTLLATGAEFLVGAMLLACAAVAVLWLLSVFLDPVAYRFFHARQMSGDEDQRGHVLEAIQTHQQLLTSGDAQRPALTSEVEARRAALDASESDLQEARTAVGMCQSELEERQQAAKGDEVALAGDDLTEAQARSARQRLADRDAAEARYTEALEQLKAARTARNDASVALQQAEAADRRHTETMAATGSELDEARSELDVIDSRHKERATSRTSAARYVILCLVLLIAEAVMLAAGDRVSLWHTLVLILVSLVTSVFAVLVYHQTKKFVWFGVAVFLAIGVFMGWALSYSIRDDPRIEPVAALVAGEEPVTGAYLTQTKDRVYVGVPRLGNGRPPLDLVALDRKAVVGLAVARLAPPEQLGALSRELAAALCARRPVATTAKALRAEPRCLAAR